MGSRCVCGQSIARQRVALAEDPVDLVSGLLSVAGRAAAAQRRGRLGARQPVTPGTPAREAPGLPRQVVERQLDRLKPAAERQRFDRAIRFRLWLWHGNPDRPALKQWNERTGAIDENARRRRGGDTLPRRPAKPFARIEELERHT